ncbi:MAG: hypothetical protein AB7D51_02770, partial [Desulfovibrionaceae bacterium]
MNRLKFYILVFTLALAIPLGYFVVRTSLGLAQEEQAELRYFAEELFARMEEELARFVEVEESRAVDEYNYLARSADGLSPLALPPSEPYVVGHFQNNPDGSLQTPLAPPGSPVPAGKAELYAKLETINAEFNTRRSTVAESPDFAQPAEPEPPQEYEPPVFAERYLDLGSRSSLRPKLGKERKRMEVPSQELLNVAPQMEFGSLPLLGGEEDGLSFGYPADQDAAREAAGTAGAARADGTDGGSGLLREEDLPPEPPLHAADAPVEVEMDPMQSMVLSDGLIYLFRRIMVNNQVFRQGVVLDVQKFMEHLVMSNFSGQPMSRFANLSIAAVDNAMRRPLEMARVSAGAPAESPVFVLDRSFTRPFDFLRA